MTERKPTMLDYFPGHKYRYIDQTGNGRQPFSSNVIRKDLNEDGYEAYFTVNGFNDANDNKKDQCTSLNAFFVDIDGRKDEKEIEAIKQMLEPSFITETKNGYHIFWLLDEPIYKDECFGTEWEDSVTRWERIEQSIVTTLKADPVVKDITRILRIPNSYYWKKTGNAYKEGLEGAIKIKGLHKNFSATYSMDAVEEVFPAILETKIDTSAPIKTENMQRYADAEKKDFFTRVQDKYPMEERPSFQRLISGHPDTLPKGEGQRNMALLITATLMRQAGWSKSKAIKQIEEVGWHGIEKERGGAQEIMNTINSAYSSAYTYSYKNEIISWNMTDEEQLKIQSVYTEVAKARRETDKVRYSNYEKEIVARYPYLRKNEIGIVFNYVGGVYKMMSDLEVSNIILNGMYEDMLWSYRDGKHVSDKIKCLLSIIPDLNLTNDYGYIFNVKNGLLNINTRELKPHTPNFVSLVQSPVEYKPYEKCPIWDSCMESWMAGAEAEEKGLLLKQFAGYCLSSSMLYDRALFLVGDGGNGKSTFVDTIAMVIGHDGTSHIDLESLYGQYGMHGLIGKRLNVIEEVHGNYYQSNKLKKLISGEIVTIDIKYKPQFTFRPQAKFIFAVNMMPRVDDTSTATERRICVVQFKNNFRNNPNTALRSDVGLLAGELSGILNWMLDGAKSLKEMKNFVKTAEQTAILAEYRQENSSVEGFIADCLEFEEGATTTTRDLYEDYKQYCTKDGRKFKGSSVFVKEMKNYGTRYQKFTFVERLNGHDQAKFEGVKISEESTVYQGSLNNF
jgi:P4 family phage/plasmid primase-like protien